MSPPAAPRNMCWETGKEVQGKGQGWTNKLWIKTVRIGDLRYVFCCMAVSDTELSVPIKNEMLPVLNPPSTYQILLWKCF